MRNLMVLGKLAFAGLFALSLVACGGSEKAEETAKVEKKSGNNSLENGHDLA
jgi:hypothetical protein